jgi:NAD(P)-dependent dehydrogenase (short-subunit alcohol dehydrogenase family)
MKNFSEIPKNILITGGTEGMGRIFIDYFRDFDPQKNQILTCSRTFIKNAELNEVGVGKVEAVTVDLADDKEVDGLIEKTRNKPIDTLVLNAAVTGITSVDGETKDIDYVNKVNVRTSLKLIDELLSKLRENHGLVIFISSSLADSKDVPEEIGLYAETKVEMESAMKIYSDKLENSSVAFLIIRPGSVNTRLHKNILSELGSDSLLRKRTQKMISEGSLRDPEVIGKILYMIADTHCLYNAQTKEYDLPISSGSTHTISDEEYRDMKNSFQ